MLPRYCCVILSCPGRGYLLESRPADARHDGGSVTCFGGTREPHENETECARREILEELGWKVGPLDKRIELWIGPASSPRSEPRFIATFFTADAPAANVPLYPEPGHTILWVAPHDLPSTNLSRWHRAVLDAHAQSPPGLVKVGLDS